MSLTNLHSGQVYGRMPLSIFAFSTEMLTVFLSICILHIAHPFKIISDINTSSVTTTAAPDIHINVRITRFLSSGLHICKKCLYFVPGMIRNLLCVTRILFCIQNIKNYFISSFSDYISKYCYISN